MTEAQRPKIDPDESRGDLLNQIFAMFKAHHTPRDIAEALCVAPAQVVRAVNRRLRDHFQLSGPGKIQAAIFIKEDHVRRLNQRLAQIQQGLTEITHKESPRGSEISEAEKFYVSAEVSLLREIRATENEINELKGLLQLSRDDAPRADDVNIHIRLDYPVADDETDDPDPDDPNL